MDNIFDAVLSSNVQPINGTAKKRDTNSTSFKREETVETTLSKQDVKSRATQTDNEDQESAREGFIRVVLQLDKAQAEVKVLENTVNDLSQELDATRNNLGALGLSPLTILFHCLNRPK